MRINQNAALMQVPLAALESPTRDVQIPYGMFSRLFMYNTLSEIDSSSGKFHETTAANSENFDQQSVEQLEDRKLTCC